MTASLAVRLRIAITLVAFTSLASGRFAIAPAAALADAGESTVAAQSELPPDERARQGVEQAGDAIVDAGPRGPRVTVGQVSLSALVRTDSRDGMGPPPAPAAPPRAGLPTSSVEQRAGRSVAPWALAAGLCVLSVAGAALARRPEDGRERPRG